MNTRRTEDLYRQISLGVEGLGLAKDQAEAWANNGIDQLAEANSLTTMLDQLHYVEERVRQRLAALN